MANRDFTKSDVQILLDQINEDNTSALTIALVSFGAVATDNGGVRNSKISATALAGSGYSGSVDFLYNRVDLATIPGARSTVFQAGDATNLSDLIDEINVAYQLNLTAADFVDAPIPAFPGAEPHETQTIDLVAKAGSLIFVGTLTLTIDANDIPLSNVVTTTTLNGLTYTQPA
jgi:Zn-dependent alcohol dehydrogenase